MQEKKVLKLVKIVWQDALDPDPIPLGRPKTIITDEDREVRRLKHIERVKAWRAKNVEKCNKIAIDHYYKKKYGDKYKQIKAFKAFVEAMSDN